MPPFFVKLWSPSPSFPVGWGVCLNLFYIGNIRIHPFFLNCGGKDWSCYCCWPHLQGLEWDELKTFCEFPLTTSYAPRVSSWCGLPGESLSPTEYAIKLGEVCWFVTSCGSLLSLSWAWTPRPIYGAVDLLSCHPVSSTGGGFDCFPVTSWKGDNLVSHLILLLWAKTAFASKMSSDTAGEITFRAFKSWKMPLQSWDSLNTFPSFGYFQVSYNSHIIPYLLLCPTFSLNWGTI